MGSCKSWRYAAARWGNQRGMIAMKRPWEWGRLFCLASFLVLGVDGKANADASQILASCEAMLREMKMNGERVVVPQSGTPCWFYLSALQDVMAFSGDGKTPLLRVCAPPEGKLTHLIRIFTQYAQKNPAELHENPALIAVRAAQQAYPCRS